MFPADAASVELIARVSVTGTPPQQQGFPSQSRTGNTPEGIQPHGTDHSGPYRPSLLPTYQRQIATAAPPAVPYPSGVHPRGASGRTGGTTGRLAAPPRSHIRPGLPLQEAERIGGTTEEAHGRHYLQWRLAKPAPPAFPYPPGAPREGRRIGQGGRREGWRHHAAPYPPGAPTQWGTSERAGGAPGTAGRCHYRHKRTTTPAPPRPPISERTGGKTGRLASPRGPMPARRPHTGGRRHGQGGPREQPAEATIVRRGKRHPRPPPSHIRPAPPERDVEPDRGEDGKLASPRGPIPARRPQRGTPERTGGATGTAGGYHASPLRPRLLDCTRG